MIWGEDEAEGGGKMRASDSAAEFRQLVGKSNDFTIDFTLFSRRLAIPSLTIFIFRDIRVPEIYGFKISSKISILLKSKK